MTEKTPRVGPGSAYVQLVRAPNPGPMTLEGTNTWVVGDPAVDAPVVVDPGPAMPEHLSAVLAAAGGRVSAVVLTHRHADHSEGAAALAGAASCSVLARDPQFRLGAGSLDAGAVLRSGPASLTVYPSPGHTDDSCSLLLRGPDRLVRLLTGDTVLGRGSTVITTPDGDLGGYLNSLALLQRLVADFDVVEILPGHGPLVSDPGGWLAACRRHREERLQQVRDAVAAGDRTPQEVVSRVYAGIDRSLWPAAEQSVRAQLDYLATIA